ncbi:MAG: thiamine phosphate synthase [Verrucomicrobia bacterium]|nr:thiamine phosphate synthase [Verrucomicrobiota bacterium]
MIALAHCRLYAFVDTGYLRGRSPVEVARQLCMGGADLIQLRAKGVAVEQVRRLAEQLLPVTNAAGVGLVINDHLDIARAIGAPICHLGQEDFFGTGKTLLSQLRPASEPLLIGLSSHGPQEAQRALVAGADYLAVGPVYPTATKPTTRPVTLEYVRWAAAHVAIPWFAIGGINWDNLDAVLAAGARRICVVSAILNADNVAGACQKFKDRLRSAPL